METPLKHPTVSVLLSENAQELGDRTAYTFLADGQDEAEALTWGRLDLEARAVAARLLRSVRPGDRAMILAADNAHFVRAFMACQHAGVIAVPVAPPTPLRNPRKTAVLQSVAHDSGAAVVLTGSTPDLHDPISEFAPELGALEWIAVDTVPLSQAADFRPPATGPEDISFLQYTSGSTSLPKGVMVTHRALLRNEEMFADIMRIGRQDVLVSWLPLFHDMGLIGKVLQNCYAGSHLVLLPPLAFVQRPSRWLRAITRYRGTVTGAPNFAYDLCVRRIPEEDRAEFDLSSLRVAFSGAEPIRPATVEAFAAAYAPHGLSRGALMHAYGLAEATLITSGTEAGAGPVFIAADREALRKGTVVPGTDHVVVGVGRARLSREIVIADPETRRTRAPGEVGEVWTAGLDTPAGYWRNAEETERTFHAHTSDTGAGPYLRTGDLGALVDGELVITGRLKDLVIVGGRNHYPQDIELTAESAHPWVRPGCGAVFAVSAGEGEADDEQVVLVAEVLRPRETRGKGARAAELPSLASIRRAVLAAVSAEHGIQLDVVHLVVPGSAPKTSSGKIQRRAAKAEFLAGTFTAAPEPESRALEGIS
ncbi:fatty acyl-AMP ligase [Actinacidiphila yeochonensis]|uniref:fatty acyl-AMP ligase n=1 Tax=Actinacidiphila yeochonensis TaxID=89050 RepID=UPI00068E09A7|nr:fatty acyl-AMP ligase [Actinacidiphila yeochonensis]